MKAYLIGGGIGSMASAAHLIRDGKVSGRDITIFEETDREGGALDAAGGPETGYSMRGGRMFNFSYVCTYDLLSFIPSLNDPRKTVLDEFQEFNLRVKTHARSRLVKSGKKMDASQMGFSHQDRLNLMKIVVHSEESLGTRQIQDCFESGFFTTPFWYMWATMFAFQPWHSAVEFKRYLHRFVHEFHRINTLSGVDRSPLNQYDSVVRPLVKWLTGQGVRFEKNTEVVDLSFLPSDREKTVERIHLLRKGRPEEIEVEESDLVFVTNGSMTESSTLGSMDSAPGVADTSRGGAWNLWKNIARRYPDFGRPEVFSERVGESKWLSFTVTQKDPLFFKLLEDFTQNAPGTGALVTFTDSSWLMSIVVAHQPHFLNQPKDVNVFWGYGLFVDHDGDYVHKPMSACTGREILTELCHHLRFDRYLPEILDSSICIPAMMPFITSQFLTRAKGDRPLVVPQGSRNLAFVSQFCEMPEDTVFTVEYSVRAAQTAVYSLLHLDKQPKEIYRGSHDVRVLKNAVEMMYKGASWKRPSELTH